MLQKKKVGSSLPLCVSELCHLVVERRAHEAVGPHVGGDLRQRLEPVQEGRQPGLPGHGLGGQQAVLVQQLVHDEVHEGEGAAGEPRVRAQELGEVLQLRRQRGQVLFLQLVLREKNSVCSRKVS